MKSVLLNFLQKILKLLARLTLQRYKPGIIGITGNVGKTSVKEALKTVLGHDRRLRAPSKNFNNEIGLPLTILGDWKDTAGAFFWFKVIFSSFFRLVWKDRRYPELLILEYGIDAPGDMKKLLEIVRPHLGVVTAIGEIPVHIEFFSGRESLVREKSKMVGVLPATGFAVLNADDSAVLEMKNNTRAHTITFGFAQSADFRISNFENHLENNFSHITFKLNYGGSFVPIRIDDVLGKSQAYAASAASAVSVAFGLHLVKASENLSSYTSPPGRLKVIPGIKKSLIIDDSYNASPLAAKEALEILKMLKAERKIAVLGDMLELGSQTMEAHDDIGRLSAKVAKILFTVGSRAKFIAQAAIAVGLPKKSVFVFNNIGEAGKALQDMIEEGDLILIKGSQAVRMEKIVKEVMAEPDKAEKLLVRQDERWLSKSGIYD